MLLSVEQTESCFTKKLLKQLLRFLLLLQEVCFNVSDIYVVLLLLFLFYLLKLRKQINYKMRRV